MSPTFATDFFDRYTDYLPLAQSLWAQPNARYAILLLIAAGVFALVTGGMAKKPANSYARDTKDQSVKRPTNTSVFRRLWWRIRPPVDLMRIDGLQIDRSRKPHCSWLAPTGGGKSSAVAVIRVDGKRPVLAVTPDLSDPLVTAITKVNGFRWTACVSTQSINFLIGSPTEVAERLTEVFRSGGVGAWKRAARRATAQVIRILDDSSEPRTLYAIGTGLAAAVKADRELRTACAGWVERFLDLADQFGSSIGPDGIDLSTLLNSGVSVLLDNDSFDHAALGGDVVALGLAEAKRCARLCPSGFRLIFEEAGQLAERIDLAEPFFRAGRRRNIPVDVLTQAESDLNDGINSNISTRIYFAQELKPLQRIAADRLGLDYHDLDPANLRDFHAFVSHGRIRRLVHFPKPPAVRPTTQPYDFCPTSSQTTSPTRPTLVIEEIGQAAPDYPMLPPPPLAVQELLDKIDHSKGDCWLWTGYIDKDGYGLQRWTYPDGRPPNNRPAHQVVWEVVNGRPFPVGPDGKPMEFDHRRTCARHCVNPGHGEPKPKLANIRAMHRTRGHVTAAD